VIDLGPKALKPPDSKGIVRNFMTLRRSIWNGSAWIEMTAHHATR